MNTIPLKRNLRRLLVNLVKPYMLILLAIPLITLGCTEDDPAHIFITSSGQSTHDHGLLSGLGGDDHVQYALIDGTRAFTGMVTMTDLYVSKNIYSGDITLYEQNDTLILDGVLTVEGIGDGKLSSYDLKVGDTITPNYGMIRFGDAVMGRTSYNAANVDLDGAVIFRNLGGPITGKVEFLWEEGSGATRFAIPSSGVGNATYNPRSMLIAGPAPEDTEMVTVGYWQTNNNIFENLAADTAGDGADLGVQNDVEIEGDLFVGSIKENISSGGIQFQPLADSTTFFQVLDFDSGVPIFNIDATNEIIGIGTANPDLSAMLDIVSTTGALLIPRMTTIQRDALAATNGMIIYNTTTNAFNFYENGAWVE